MKILCLIAIASLTSQAAFAADAAKPQTVSGNGALALAALVAEYSPLVSPNDRRTLADFLAGFSKRAFLKSYTITVTVDSLICRASDVDLTEHACDLVFGTKTAQLHGRKAHELYTTLAEIGAPSEGAAGTIFKTLSKLSCTIDSKEIADKDGGGADCQFTPGV